jgi:hypothetical protein
MPKFIHEEILWKEKKLPDRQCRIDKDVRLWRAERGMELRREIVVSSLTFWGQLFHAFTHFIFDLSAPPLSDVIEAWRIMECSREVGKWRYEVVIDVLRSIELGSEIEMEFVAFQSWDNDWRFASSSW